MRKTQLQKVKEVLETTFGICGGIITFSAFTEFGITRLSAKIYDLRHKYGMDIVSIRETSKNRFGEKVSYKRYLLNDNLTDEERTYHQINDMKG